MDSNPYPSPPSSSNLDVTYQPSAARAENHVHTDLGNEDNEHGSFQRTFGRLDAAFSRIRQLRRDLLAEQARNQEGSSASSVGPAHEAIVLTGQRERSYTEEALERMRNIVPSDVRERLRQFEARRTEADRERDRERFSQQLLRAAAAAHMQPLDTSITPSFQSSFSPSSPLSPPRQRLLPQRSLLDTQPLRRRELPDDPNTDLGRRVALRESAGNSLSRESSRALPTVIERDFEYIRSLARQRRSEPAALRRVESSLDHLRREVENRVSRSMDHANGPQSPSAGTPVRGPIRRMRMLPSRQNSNPSSASSNQDRLSLLSNFSVQGLPTPTSALSQPPLLFDEPTSYIQPSPSQAVMEERDRPHMESIDEENPGRSYVIHQNDIVHNINMDWEEVPSGSLLMSSPVSMEPPEVIPRVGRNDHRRDDTVTVRPSEYAAPVYPEVATRPLPDHTYDRLPLGDVHYTSYERPVGSRWHPNITSFTRDDFGPVTRSQTTLDYDGEENPYPRVRLSSHDPGDGFLYTLLPNGTYARRPRSPCADPPRVFGTRTPRFIDPLPSDLVDKHTSSSKGASQTKAHTPNIPVQIHTCLAGR